MVAILNKYRKRKVTLALQMDIQKQIGEATRKHLQDYTSQLKVENRALGAYEGEFAASTLNGIVEADDFKATVPTAAAVNSVATITPIKLGANSYTSYSSMMKNYWGKWSDEIHGVVQAGFLEGSTIPEITNAITAQMDLSKSGTTKSVLDRARRSAKQLAITGVNHYANTARIAFVDKNDDILKGYRFLAVNDSRTCLLAGEEILMADGSKKAIELISEGEFVIGHSGNKRKVLGTLTTTEKQVLRVTLSTGKIVKCTRDHLWLTNNRGWVEAGDLTVEDDIATVPHLHEPSKKEN